MNKYSQTLATIAQLQQQIALSGILASATVTTNSTPTYVKRPWLDPPEGYSPFDQPGVVTLGGVSTVPQTILTLIVDNGWDGAINFFSAYVVSGGFTDFSGDLQWSLLADSKPIRNFNNILNQRGSSQQARPVPPIRIYSGQVITLQVAHLANPALTGGQVGGSITGFTYPNRG